MDESTLFMQWAVDTLQHEHQHPAAVLDDCGHGETTFPSLQALREISIAAGIVVPELITEAYAANSWGSGDANGSEGGDNFSCPVAMENDVWLPTPNSARCAPTNLPVMSWDFNAGSTQPGSDGTPDATAARAYERGVLPMVIGGPQPTRRAPAWSAASTVPASSPYAQDHIIAERKRREKINQRFIELSTVIPGLKKMDKATILSDATRHVKELQEKIKDLEAAGSNVGSMETVVLVKNPCLATPDSRNGCPSPASTGAPPVSRNPLPEIEARFSEKTVMVRIHCEDAKGVVVRVLSEVEEGLHLSIKHANVMVFAACTAIITITAKVEEGFTVTADEIVGRLNSALQQHSCCSSPEETRN